MTPTTNPIAITDPHAGVLGHASEDPELLRQCEASGQMSAAQMVWHRDELGKRSTSAATASGHELPDDTAAAAASLSVANGGDARVASAGCALPRAWPAGLLERVKAAEQRIADNHAPRRIPADPNGDVDLVLAEVRLLIEGKWPPFWINWISPAGVDTSRGGQPE